MVAIHEIRIRVFIISGMSEPEYKRMTWHKFDTVYVISYFDYN